MTSSGYAAVAGLVAAALVLTGPELAEARGKRGKAKPARASAPSIPPLTRDGLPNVLSESAFVVDVGSGAVVYAKDPDKVRPIASTGKIFVAMVVRRRGIDLEALTEITQEDADLARGGARTRLFVGHRFKNIDLLRAMLMAADNRAPSALGRAVGLSVDELIAEKNKLARELGLTKTHFTDPSGLRGNESTAREMAVAMRASLEDPVIAEILATQRVTVRSEHEKPRVIDYANTVRPLHGNRYPILGGKTGYTEPAGYCLVITAEVEGRTLAMSFLGASGKLTRFGDFGRVSSWAGASAASGATAAAD